MTRLGEDEFGRQFLDLWREEGLNTTGVGIDSDAHTGVYFIHYGAQGHVFSYLRAGSAASRMRPEHLPLELIRSARFFHTSAISQAISASACDTVFAAIDAARAAKVSVTYDSNLRLRLWPIARARA
jgi:2-dehydro-3-deoxygluconokinase